MAVHREDVDKIVDIVLIALAKVAQTTRTPADDVMVGILKANRARLADAVAEVLQHAGPTTEEMVVAALRRTGIKVP